MCSQLHSCFPVDIFRNKIWDPCANRISKPVRRKLIPIRYLIKNVLVNLHFSRNLPQRGTCVEESQMLIILLGVYFYALARIALDLESIVGSERTTELALAYR